MKLNIGITLGFNKETKDVPYNIYANGLRQHTFFLYDTLKELDITKNVYLVNCGSISYKEQAFTKDIFDQTYQFRDFVDVENELDLLIEFGMEVDTNRILKIKKNGCKFIGYGAGNSYVLGIEKMIYDTKTGNVGNKSLLYDAYWTNAQHVNTCKSLWEHLYKCEVQVVPHIWDSKFIDLTAQKFETLPETPKVAILEPNINVVKTFIIPLLISEKYHQECKGEKQLGHVYVTNSYKLKDRPFFRRVVNPLQLLADKKVSFESRFKTGEFLNKYADIVITHQWENGLNYLYYELMHLHYPLVHNSPFFKNVAYYYPDFNVDEGVKQLKKLIETHNNNMEDYNKKCDQYIWDLNPKNPNISKEYAKQIKKLFKKRY